MSLSYVSYGFAKKKKRFFLDYSERKKTAARKEALRDKTIKKRIVLLFFYSER